MVLELKEEEEGLGWKGRFYLRTHPSSSHSNFSCAGGAAGGLSFALTAASARPALPASVEVLPTSSSRTQGCGGLPDVVHSPLSSQP